MTLVVVGSAKGSPGATTTAAAIANAWPGPADIVECDPAGGDLAARFQLAATPGLAGLADPNTHLMSARQDLGLDRVGAVVGSVGSWDVTGSLDWEALASTMAAAPHLILADVGRLGAGPFEELVAQAHAILLCARRDLSAMAHLKAVLGWVAQLADTPSGVVLIGQKGPWSDQAVATELGADVLGSLPWVPALEHSGQQRGSPKAPDLRPLRRAASDIANRLGQLLASSARPAPAEPPMPPPDPATPTSTPARVTEPPSPAAPADGNTHADELPAPADSDRDVQPAVDAEQPPPSTEHPETEVIAPRSPGRSRQPKTWRDYTANRSAGGPSAMSRRRTS